MVKGEEGNAYFVGSLRKNILVIVLELRRESNRLYDSVHSFEGGKKKSLFEALYFLIICNTRRCINSKNSVVLRIIW